MDIALHHALCAALSIPVTSNNESILDKVQKLKKLSNEYREAMLHGYDMEVFWRNKYARTLDELAQFKKGAHNG